MNAVSPTDRVFEQSRNALEDETARQGGINTYHISVNFRLSSEVLFFFFLSNQRNNAEFSQTNIKLHGGFHLHIQQGRMKCIKCTKYLM